MSTPQRSRYPRPLKATRTFSGGSQSQNGAENRLAGAGSRSLSPPNVETGVSSGGDGENSGGLWTGASSPPRVYRLEDECGGTVAPTEGCLPEETSASHGSRSGGVRLDCKVCDVVGCCCPRRSNSLGSLADPDSYMNSAWPSLTMSTTQCEAEEEPLLGSSCEDSLFSHKRSNSCSSADRLKIARPLGFKSTEVGPTHTRISVEGLNQEVSSALEGNPTHLIQTTPTDGRVAPVRDLLVRANAGTRTPPSLTVSTPHLTSSSSSSSSHSPHPPVMSSPSSTSTSISSTAPADSHHQGTSSSSLDSPAHLSHLPPSPKPSFAREPPDGAERCTIKMDTYVRNEGLVLQGPDKTKGTIIFKGNVFSPLLV